MKDWFESFDWKLSKRSTLYPMENYHPYFAKFNPLLPERFILKFSKKNHTIFDPFHGSGAALYASLQNSRNAIGVDANPIANLITRVKFIKFTKKDKLFIIKLLKKIEKDIEKFPNLIKKDLREDKVFSNIIPVIYNFDKWFSQIVINELAIIKFNILKCKKKNILNILLLSFSRIIVKVSNQYSESKYVSVIKKKSFLETFTLYKKATLDLIDCLEKRKFSKKNKVNVYLKDTINTDFIKSSTVDLIVTSPPYLNSWDYALYHRFRFLWLDMKIKEYENIEIGKHLRTIEGRGKKTDEVKRYEQDMKQVISNCFRVLKKNSFFILIVSDSIVQKKFIDTGNLLINISKKLDLF